MKLLRTLFAFAVLFISFANAQEYKLFYADGCPHCEKVEEFLQKNDLLQKYNIKELEVRKNQDNLKIYREYLDLIKLDVSEASVPLLVIGTGENCNYYKGDKDIVSYFVDKLNLTGSAEYMNLTGVCTTGIINQDVPTSERLKFFAIMLPAALSDSINPCEFAVMLLLLSSILSRKKSRKKVVLAGILFSLAVFLSYFAMGVGLFSILSTADNTFVIKLIVGILGLVVGLANLKDFFRYGKGFVMEVPFSRRPKMADIIDRAASPAGAFVVGLIVSLFLLPCTSGPYFTILGYLASESKNLHLRGYIYLFIYNLVFIVPMLIITVLVGFGFKSIDQLAKIKHDNTKLIHLIVGLLMIGLGLYVLVTL